MAEVKKSWFLAIDTSDLAPNDSAADILTAGNRIADPPATDSADDRTAFLLEPSGLPDLSLDYEEVTRDVIRDSYLPAVPLRGIINTTGSMTFEFHGGGANGTSLKKPDYHPLLASGFGGSTYRSAVVSLDPGYTNQVPGDSLTFTNSISAVAGDILVWRCDDTAGTGKSFLITQVTNAATATQAVLYFGAANGGGDEGVNATPNWELIPSAGYYMPTSLSAIGKFAIAYYRGNIVREVYAKCTTSSIEFPFTAGELILPVFNFNVGDGSVASQAYYNSATGDYDTTILDTNATGTTQLSSTVASPLFAKAVDWKFEFADVVNNYTTASWNEFGYLGGGNPAAKIVDSFTLTLNNETSIKRDITAAEGIHSYGVQGRSVELALTAYYDDTQTDFNENLTKLFLNADNAYRIRVSAITGSTAGNRCFLFAPRLSFKPTVVEDTGLFKYDITGSAEKDDFLGENALTCVFF